VAELVQVRQDAGVQAGAEEPDWELIEKLHEIAEQDDVEVPDVPEAPDLDVVEADLGAQKDGEENTSVTPDLSAQALATPSTTSAPSSDVVTWDLAEGEDLWPEASSEEE